MITITSDNINQYRDGPIRPEITEITWKADNLDSTLRKLPNLVKLRCQGIKTLDGIEHAQQLTSLDCSDNKLQTLKPLNALKQLTHLSCGQNKLSTLSDLYGCSLLTKLYCEDNKLTGLDGIYNFPLLRVLVCFRCGLTSLVELYACQQLEALVCWGNKLSSLKGLEASRKLNHLNCHDTTITSLAPLANCSKLVTVFCSHNNLQSLAGLNCTALKSLNCWNNPLKEQTMPLNASQLEFLSLTSSSIPNLNLLKGCPQLRCLECEYCFMPSLEGLVHCPLLEMLVGPYNRFTSLDQIRYCPQLRVLKVDNNLIKSLAPLQACPLLQRLTVRHNKLTTLEGLELSTSLKVISCGYNKLATLRGIDWCVSLGTLYCYSNQIESLENLVYLRRLRILMYNDNPLGVQSTQVVRFLEMYKNRFSRKTGSFYNNGQTVHDVHIQKTVCESVQKLVADPKPTCTFDAVSGSSLDPRAVKLAASYCADSYVHSDHLLTYLELLMYVWARIVNHEHKDELIRILGEQILESRGLCFTGRFNRTLSVLVGFYSDIVIEISDSSRIGAIILKAGEDVRSNSPEAHRELARVMLTDAGYSTDEMQPWLEAIV